MKLANTELESAIPVTDYKTTSNTHGVSLLSFLGCFCMTVYENKEFQIFHTEKGNYVFSKGNEKITQLTIERWTKLVLDIERELLYAEHKSVTIS